MNEKRFCLLWVWICWLGFGFLRIWSVFGSEWLDLEQTDGNWLGISMCDLHVFLINVLRDNSMEWSGLSSMLPFMVSLWLLLILFFFFKKSLLCKLWGWIFVIVLTVFEVFVVLFHIVDTLESGVMKRMRLMAWTTSIKFDAVAKWELDS